jgi:hypothetical protein
MAEYWQDTLARAQVTTAVWTAHFSDLALGAVSLDDFTDKMDALPGLAAARDAALQVLDERRQTRDFAYLLLRGLVISVPKIIEGVVDETSGLLDDLDKAYAIPPWSPANVLARGYLLAPTWAAANTWQAAQTPPRSALVRGATTQANFVTQLQAFPQTERDVAAAEVALQGARGALRRAAAELDRLNKRFLKAATGLAEPGSAAADALATIPTESDSPLPDTLGIKTLSQGGTGGLQLLVSYEPYDDDSAEAKRLQWMVVDVDAGWDHEVPVDPSGNAFGPFVAGQVVKVRTVVTNASGSRESGSRQLTILAPG